MYCENLELNTIINDHYIFKIAFNGRVFHKVIIATELSNLLKNNFRCEQNIKIILQYLKIFKKKIFHFIQ